MAHHFKGDFLPSSHKFNLKNKTLEKMVTAQNV